MKSIILLTLSSLYIYAADAFISPQDLHDKMKNDNLVILDVTTKEAYENEHIPGAVRADVGQFRKKVLMHQEIRSEAEIQNIARSYGINNDSEVVLYGHGKAKELMKSTYIALSLLAHGVKNVSILNGGFTAWSGEYIDSSDETPQVKDGNFVAKSDAKTLVNMDYVKEKLGKVKMLDSRGYGNYFGTVISGGVERLGHIPHATNSYWQDKFNKDDTVKDDEFLEEMIIEGLGLNDLNQEVVLYCTGGLEGSANWYIFSQHLGFKNAKLYDGSMRDWGNNNDTPLTKYKWE
ncbi:rhodanese-like domain-containing protein [Sulfurimonas sp.]|nr:rhodanese-like domain-containing protein [Sulfurimonas sp.]